MRPSDDLSSTAVLAIAGVEVQAWENETARNIGESKNENPPTHRADVLMLFTERVDDPYVMRQDPTSPIILSNVTQVTYGHADFATLTQNSSGVWTFSTTDVRRFAVASGATGDPVSEERPHWQPAGRYLADKRCRSSVHHDQHPDQPAVPDRRGRRVLVQRRTV
jgi:hypothetical protein